MFGLSVKGFSELGTGQRKKQKMDGTLRSWHCDVCPGGLRFGSAQEKARHFVSKRHAIHLDNRHKADRGQLPRQKSKEETERLKDMAALLKACRRDANALHARQETMLVSLQLLDDRINGLERVWTARKRKPRPDADHQHDEEDDNEEGAWSERKQRLFMARIYDILKQNGIAQDQVPDRSSTSRSTAAYPRGE